MSNLFHIAAANHRMAISPYRLAIALNPDPLAKRLRTSCAHPPTGNACITAGMKWRTVLMINKIA